MTSTYYKVAFNFEGIDYDGRLSPEFKHGHSGPASWHVVLNDVFFGYLHKDGGVWGVNEQRPARLTEKLGEIIDHKKYVERTAD